MLQNCRRLQTTSEIIISKISFYKVKYPGKRNEVPKRVLWNAAIKNPVPETENNTEEDFNLNKFESALEITDQNNQENEEDEGWQLEKHKSVAEAFHTIMHRHSHARDLCSHLQEF